MSNQFSIQFVSQITGINAHTIRAWEKRYQVILPSRDINGRRLYSQNEIDLLEKINHLVKLGNNISDVAKLSLKSITELYKKYEGARDKKIDKKNAISNNSTMIDDSNFSNKNLITNSFIDYNSVLQNLVLALHNYKLDIISHELDKIKLQLDSRSFALHIIYPLFLEVSEQVNSQHLSIAQEHALSALLKFHIGHFLYSQYDLKNKNSHNTIVLATPEGELHEFGILIGALLCSYYKTKFYYLGPSMPAKSLADACNQIKSNILILGVTKNYTTNPLCNIDQFHLELSEYLNPSIKVLIGGTKLKKKFKNTEFIPTLQSLDHYLANL